MRRLLAAVAAATVALTGCQSGGPGGDRPTTVETRFLDALDAAIDDLNSARARLADDANAISEAAAALDDVDEAAVTGDREAVRAKRPAAAKAMPAASKAARRLGKDVRAYRAAVTALDKAKADGLDPAQQQAVAGVVTAARRELKELKTYGTVIAAAWPRYEKLSEDQTLWLARASNGWYRDQKEAAGNYALLTDRARLASDRRSLARADSRRLAAARAATRAVGQARTALASLRD